MSQYTYNFTSALSDHKIAFVPSARFSKNSQKHRKATPKFQLSRTKLVKRTRSSAIAARSDAIGNKG